MPHVFIITTQLIPETNIWSSLAAWRTGIGGVVTVSPFSCQCGSPTALSQYPGCFKERYGKSYSFSLKQHIKGRIFCLDNKWVLHKSVVHTLRGVVFALLYWYVIHLWEGTPLLCSSLDVQRGTSLSMVHVSFRGTTRAQRSFPPR